MEPLAELMISTHGRGEPVSGSVTVLSDGPIGGVVRYSVPEIGVAGVGPGQPTSDALFPVRRQAGGIRTAAALHNLEAEAMGVNCRLMSGGGALEEVEIHLEANGQTSWFIEDAFTTTDTSDFAGSVRCTAPGNGRFTAVALEMDAANRIFTTLPVVPVDPPGSGNQQTTLDFAHFANGTGITSEMVFLNPSTQPSRPAVYFYDTEGNPIAPESVVDITGDLKITEDGALTVRTEMEPLGVLTISTHGRGPLVSGSVRVVSEGPIGGLLRFDHPALGGAGVADGQPVSDAIFPVRRQERGINTGVAIHNLESSSGSGALRIDARRPTARRRECPVGDQRADGLVPRHGVPRRRYVRLRGVGALHLDTPVLCGEQGKRHADGIENAYVFFLTPTGDVTFTPVADAGGTDHGIMLRASVGW